MAPPSREPLPPSDASRTASTAAVRVLSHALGALPLGANRTLGALIGRLAWLARGRSRRVAEINLALCFPGLDAPAREALAKAALVEEGRALAELGWCWHRPRATLEARVAGVAGAGLLDEALADPRGALLVTPHFGAWELSALVPARDRPLGYFYRPPRRAALEPLLVAGRANLGGEPLKLGAGGIRAALGRLRNGGTVGILPDQEPERDGGVFAPLFGVPALTMTLLPRLARRSGARVLFVVVERLAGGWRYHCLEPAGDVAAADPVEAAAAVNRSVEACVAIAPEQYLWSYRRFRELPAGGRRDYSPGSVARVPPVAR